MLVTFHQLSILSTENGLFFGQSANLILPLTEKNHFWSKCIDFIIQAPNIQVYTYKTYYFFKNNFGQHTLFFWSTHNLDNRDATKY